jgi:hypothetical protein
MERARRNRKSVRNFCLLTVTRDDESDASLDVTGRFLCPCKGECLQIEF